jgi:hypothetical protein
MDGCRRCDERRKKGKGKKKEEEREEEESDRHPEPGKAEKDFRGRTTRTMVPPVLSLPDTVNPHTLNPCTSTQ